MAYIGASPPATALTASDIADGIISEAKMANDAISLAELKAGTDGEVISWDASGNPVAIGAGSSGEFLKSQGAGSQPVFAAAGGAWNLISTFTSDGSDATASFTSGLDSTYDEYCFKFINIHPESVAGFEFNGSTDTGSNYNVTKTSTFFKAHHNEGDSEAVITYMTDYDLAQSTAFQVLHSYGALSTQNDSGLSGYLYLYGLSSTTYVKNFIARTMCIHQSGTPLYFAMDSYCAGYMNTTSAVDAIQFKMDSGEIQGGKIKLYGIS